jgi:type IV secretion system protein VirB1
MLAIARTESALHPYAISLNEPQKIARYAGYPDARVDLARAPQSPGEARRWAHWFRAHGFTTSIGIMQINTEVAPLYGVSESELFNPCVNVRVASQILGNAYTRASKQYRDPAQALAAAISSYNTGNWQNGISNGYVKEVYRNVRRLGHVSNWGIP